MRQLVASYTGEQVLTLQLARLKVRYRFQVPIHCMHACMQLEAVLWWQNHFSITLSQLLEHRYHVMHIRLPNKHNVVNHFCLQVFLSEQSFPSLSMSGCSSFYYCYFSRLEIAASSNLIPAADIVQSYAQGFFCQQVLSMILNTFLFRVSTGIYVKRCIQFKYHTYHVHFRPGRFTGIAGNTKNHGNNGKFHKTHQILGQI